MSVNKLVYLPSTQLSYLELSVSIIYLYYNANKHIISEMKIYKIYILVVRVVIN